MSIKDEANPAAKAPFVERLAHFLNAHRQLTIKQPRHERLGRFLELAGPKLRALRAKGLAGAKREAIKPTVDIVRFSSIIPELNQLMARSRIRGEGINPWAVSGLRHHEVRNVGVLASLWNPRLCGDEATKFLTAWLRRVPDLDLELIDRVANAKNYWVRPEDRSISGEQDRRADITIEGDGFFLIIEAKIYAGESGEDQYVAYNEIANSRRVAGNLAAFILLAPTKPKDFPYSFASWSDVAVAALACLPRRRNEHSFHARLLNNFTQHISNF